MDEIYSEKINDLIGEHEKKNINQSSDVKESIIGRIDTYDGNTIELILVSDEHTKLYLNITIDGWTSKNIEKKIGSQKMNKIKEEIKKTISSFYGIDENNIKINKNNNISTDKSIYYDIEVKF